MTATERGDATGTALVDVEQLLELAQACFEGLGVAPADARAVAEVLVDSDLHGVHSHGVQRIPIYMRRVRAGLAGGSAAVAVVAEHGAVCRIDGAGALGPAVAVRATDRAVELARRHGAGVVAVGRSTHFGAAGPYVRRAAAAGCASIVLTNATKRMTPYGAREAFLGTNAVAVGVPLGERPPFVLDMATSVSAQGKITRARNLGEEIPLGVALDPDGNPTTDPAAALAGSLLPIGGPKGSGLALAITLLCVLLGGADADDQMASLYHDFERPQNTGHVVIAIDPARFGADPAAADAVIARLLALAPLDPAQDVRYPGRSSGELARERRRKGLPVSRADLGAIAGECRDAGLATLDARARALRDA